MENENEQREFIRGFDLGPLDHLFFDDAVLQQLPYKLFRLNTPKGRYYVEMINEAGVDRLEFYPGLSTYIRAVNPKADQLIEWMAKMGIQAAYDYMRERGVFGSFMHGSFADLIIGKSYPLDEVRKRMMEMYDKEGFDVSMVDKVADREKLPYWYLAQKALVSLSAYINLYNVKTIAIELTARSQKWGYATMMDWVVEQDVYVKGYHGEVYKSGANKGEPKETVVVRRQRGIVDFKSGDSFYEDNEIQLAANALMYEENFPDAEPLQFTANWRPKAWESFPEEISPTNRATWPWHWVDQSTKHDREYVEALLAYAKLKVGKRQHGDRNVTVLSGILEPGKERECITTQQLRDAALAWYAELNMEDSLDGRASDEIEL